MSRAPLPVALAQFVLLVTLGSSVLESWSEPSFRCRGGVDFLPGRGLPPRVGSNSGCVPPSGGEAVFQSRRSGPPPAGPRFGGAGPHSPAALYGALSQWSPPVPRPRQSPFAALSSVPRLPAARRLDSAGAFPSGLFPAVPAVGPSLPRSNRGSSTSPRQQAACSPSRAGITLWHPALLTSARRYLRSITRVRPSPGPRTRRVSDAWFRPCLSSTRSGDPGGKPRSSASRSPPGSQEDGDCCKIN
ncbi:hypothetical protein NDU88_002290 [Pleurodeles waltl]|uniref:Uncharacterized protein n=1 Tax=Pleurodeles waltl TaxID=8319 RepID=A0AAV7KV76_PLEWA|nr:hypothetical protein NDU88_002290 [Pleurodeles waltl]